MTITSLESQLLKASRMTDYGDAGEDAVWTFAVVDAAEMDEQQAKGVLSSLVKKGLAKIQDTDDDSIFWLTDLGLTFTV